MAEVLNSFVSAMVRPILRRAARVSIIYYSLTEFWVHGHYIK